MFPWYPHLLDAGLEPLDDAREPPPPPPPPRNVERPAGGNRGESARPLLACSTPLSLADVTSARRPRPGPQPRFAPVNGLRPLPPPGLPPTMRERRLDRLLVPQGKRQRGVRGREGETARKQNENVRGAIRWRRQANDKWMIDRGGCCASWLRLLKKSKLTRLSARFCSLFCPSTSTFLSSIYVCFVPLPVPSRITKQLNDFPIFSLQCNTNAVSSE